MIGGLTANLICSPHFKEGNVDHNFYFFIRGSWLGPDSLFALSVGMVMDNELREQILENFGNKAFRSAFYETVTKYKEEALEDKKEISFISVDKESEEIVPEFEDSIEYDMIAVSGAVMVGLHHKEQMDVVIDAQRVATSITNKRDVIEASVNMALLYHTLMNQEFKGKEKEIIQQKKQLIEAYVGNSCHPYDIKHWEDYNLTGLSDGNCKEAIAAFGACILDSTNFEDAVKKSGSCFHQTSFLSFMCGLFAENLFSVPKDISDNGYTMISESPTIYEALGKYEGVHHPSIGKKRNFITRNF